MRKPLLRAVMLATLVGTMPAVAAEDCAAIAERAAAAWRATTTVSGLAEIDAVTAACVQKTLVRDLGPDLGPPVGYKVGLTGKAMQERLGVDHPVSGVLLQRMLGEPGAPVPAGYAARPLVEADLIAVIGDSTLNSLAAAINLGVVASAIKNF
jgi:2-oxo-hept-3-ene-1,7-dioate hydratase